MVLLHTEVAASYSMHGMDRYTSTSMSMSMSMLRLKITFQVGTDSTLYCSKLQACRPIAIAIATLSFKIQQSSSRLARIGRSSVGSASNSYLLLMNV